MGEPERLYRGKVYDYGANVITAQSRLGTGETVRQRQRRTARWRAAPAALQRNNDIRACGMLFPAFPPTCTKRGFKGK